MAGCVRLKHDISVAKITSGAPGNFSTVVLQIRLEIFVEQKLGIKS